MDPVGYKGGLLLLWNDNVNLTILSYSVGHIDCVINLNPSLFYFMGFYGDPNHNNRTHSWNLLHKISLTHSNRNFGWLVGGDFNEILYDHEKKGGNLRSPSLIEDFRKALSSNELYSINSSGPSYTWDNKRSISNQILVRLDRYVANAI